MHTTQIGDKGEQMASEELVRLGYEIIERNWKVKIAEVDIVAQKDKVMYFVEVKYRETLAQGDGFDYITPGKLSHMARAADLWVEAHGYRGEYAMLAIAIHGQANSIEIREVI
jgi:putative endonuclease